MRVRPKLPRVLRFTLRKSTPFFADFPQVSCRLAAVAAVAQASQVAAVGEERHVALVVNAVVDVRCPHSLALLGTFLAERLSKELRGAKIVCPYR